MVRRSTLAANLTYANDFTINGGTLALGGKAAEPDHGKPARRRHIGKRHRFGGESAIFAGTALEGSVVLSNAGSVTASGTSMSAISAATRRNS